MTKYLYNDEKQFVYYLSQQIIVVMENKKVSFASWKTLVALALPPRLVM